jgi:uncharacterized protein (UPF0332 family)
MTAGLLNDTPSRSNYFSFHAVSLLFFLHNWCLSATSKLSVTSTRPSFVEAFLQGSARNLDALFEARQTGDYVYHVQFDRKEAHVGIAKLDTILAAIRQHVNDQHGTALL